MAEFDDNLNRLLSDSDAMDQIMRMARSLMGGAAAETGNTTPPQSPPPQAQPWNSGGQTAQSGTASAPPYSETGPTQSTPPQNNSSAGNGFHSGFSSSGGGGTDWSVLSALGGIDPQTIAKLLPILKELNGPQDTNARQLLFALRPYLKPERQEKVERALQLARLFHVGKKFLLKGDLHV